jgi:putative ATP-binding cassette transporter
MLAEGVQEGWGMSIDVRQEPLDPTPPARRSQIVRFIRLAGPVLLGDGCWGLRLLAISLGVLTVCQIVAQVLLNLWSARLFDALEERNMDAFLFMVGLFALILLGGTAVTVTHLRVKRRLQLRWRTWLTQRLLGDWMSDARYYQLGYLPGDYDNPDGRIAEDIRITTEVALELAHSMFYSLLLLVSFTQILWRMSGEAHLDLGFGIVAIPGYLVLIAVCYALAGTTVAVLLGRPLVRAADRRQHDEASFRFGLANVRENAGKIALAHADTDESRRLSGLFKAVAMAWDRQTDALTNLFLFTQAYSTLSVAFPVLIVSPRYIAGTISLGVLMQTAQAFQQMAAGLSWPIDNLARVAEWRASVARVLGLHEALEQLKDQAAERVTIAAGEANALAVRDLVVSEPDGTPVLRIQRVEFRPRERVLITGDQGAAFKLFKAVAGLWPWGCGRVELPAGERVHFVAQKPFLPRGTLRDAVCYPPRERHFDDTAIAEAFKRVDLSALTPKLDHVDIWDQALSVAEQQRLSFARLLLHRPSWIVLLEATDALDPPCEHSLMRLLEEEFADAAVITIGHRGHLEEFHTLKYVLARKEDNVYSLEPEKRLRRETVGALKWQK